LQALVKAEVAASAALQQLQAPALFTQVVVAVPAVKEKQQVAPGAPAAAERVARTEVALEQPELTV
jgi:hypothetical protein